MRRLSPIGVGLLGAALFALCLVGCGRASGGRHIRLELDEATLKQLYFEPLDEIVLQKGEEQAPWSKTEFSEPAYSELNFDADGGLLVELHHLSGLSDVVSSSLRRKRIRLRNSFPVLDKLTISVKNKEELRELATVKGVTVITPAKALIDVQSRNVQAK